MPASPWDMISFLKWPSDIGKKNAPLRSTLREEANRFSIFPKAQKSSKVRIHPTSFYPEEVST
jgi:hypothetical protein